MNSLSSAVIAVSLLSMTFLRANPGGEGPEIVIPQAPWLTGPLVAPSPYVIPRDHFAIEPYLYYTVTTGRYNSHWHADSVPHFKSVNVQVPIWIGLANWMDMQIVAQGFYNTTQGKSSTRFGDIFLLWDFQLVTDSSKSWTPAVKLTAGLTLPTGKYQRLDPDKLKTDAVGDGSLEPTIGLVIGHLYHFPPAYPWAFMTRLSLFYTIETPVHVKGFNAFGGGFKTHGKVFPGNFFIADLGLELTLTKHWDLALDIVYEHQDKQRFSGRRGFTSPGVPAVMKAPSNESFSLAPAIEYNWNQSIGIIAGAWFTVAGRNHDRFWSGVVAFNYYQ